MDAQAESNTYRDHFTNFRRGGLDFRRLANCYRQGKYNHLISRTRLDVESADANLQRSAANSSSVPVLYAAGEPHSARRIAGVALLCRKPASQRGCLGRISGRNAL